MGRGKHGLRCSGSETSSLPSLLSAYSTSSSTLVPLFLYLEVDCKLNWDLVQSEGFDAESSFTYPIPRLHCCLLESSEELSVELVSCIPRLFSHCHLLQLGTVREGSGVPELLETIRSSSSNGGTVTMLCLYIHSYRLSAGNIDFAVDYFQREPINFEKCIPHVSYSANIPLGGWPSSCSPREAGKVVEPNKQWIYGWREAREYSFINEPSGRRFRVWLELEGYGRERITYLHLLF
jgi:hypothetical protein